MSERQCTNKAEWWLTEGPGPDEYTVCCTEHLSVMVSDKTTNIACADLDEPCCHVGSDPETLPDQRLAEIQRASDDDWVRSLDEALSWADLDMLIAEVREARKRIAELEEDDDE